MKKKVLSMILAIAMVISMFAGLATTASAASYTWTRVTSIETLKTGGQFIIGYEANANSGVIIPMANTGSATTSAAGFMYSGAAAASGDKTTIDMNTYSQDGSAFVVTIAESAVTSGSVTVSAAGGYIGNANTKNNVKLFAEDSVANGTAYTVAMDANNVFTLKNANATYHTLSYNTGSPRFACYGGTQKNVVIYQRAESDAPACEHANTEERAEVAATCTEVGYTAGVFCADCQTYISGHETIGALGHAWDEGVETLAATCTVAGEKTYTCTREGCGVTKIEAIPATGHSYVDGVCSVCDAVEPTDSTFTKVTDVSTLADGDTVIFVNADATYALGITQNSSNRAAVAVTANEDGTITADIESVEYITLGAATTEDGTKTGWSFYTGEGYLYASSGSSNQLKTQETNNDNGIWAISIADGVTTVTAQGSNSRNTMRYNPNNGTPLFNCYASTSTTGTTVEVYKAVKEVVTDCQHTNATEVAAASATCTTAGNSAYWSCPDCGKYFSDAACTTETTLEAVTIAATGHTPGAYTSNNDGTHAYTCSVCTETVTENCTAVEVETIAATCTSYSSTDYECSVCGGAWTVIGTEYAAHNYVNGVCSVCSDALDKYVKVTDLSTLAAGDTVVIYHPTSNMALTATASGSKLAGAAGQIDTTGNGMMYIDGAAVMTVAKNEAGQYQFSIVDAESNTLYLTSGATGNSLTFAAAPAEGATDYTLWTIVADTTDSTIAYIKSVNASYNSNVQALEYFNGFTTFGEKTTAAYQFNFYKPYVEGEHVHSYTSEVTTPATCLTEGLKTYTCACGDSYTEAIPATGHSYAADAVAGTACANGCGHTLIEGKKTVALEDGMTVIFYSANISMAMDTVANGTYLNAIAPNTAAGDTLLIDDGVALMTVEVVEGGYRFKLGDNYLSYRGGRNTLVFEPLTDAVVTDETAGTTTDYTVFAVENGNALYCVNGDYDYNGNVNKLYLEAYGDHYTSYNCSDNTGAAFVFSFYTTSEVCDHVADAGTVTTAATCTEPGVMTYTCTTCGKVLYIAEIPATGHNYVDGVCTNCGEAEPNFEGDWYIAVARSTGNYFYMENTMQNTAGTRFTAVDSGLTALPEAITEGAMPEYVFHIAKNADGSYVMYSNYVEGDNKYVGWNGGKTNTATLVAEANARAFTVAKNDDGTVTFELIKSADETTAEAAARYFSMNGSTGNDYFAWYKLGQRSDLTLIPVSGEIHVHSYTVSESVDATCTTDGSVTYTCSCGKTYTETVPATGHTLELVDAVAATCTTDGNDAYYKCSVCGALFSDAEGTTALDAIPTVSATGHTYTYTDNSDGTHTKTCSVCGDTTAEAHSFVDGGCVCGAAEVVAPIVDSNISIGKVLSLESDLSIKFRVRLTQLTNYDLSTAYLEVEKDMYPAGGTMFVRTEQLEGYTEGDRLVFKFAGIAACEMNDEIRATLHIFDTNGQEYVSEQIIYSICTYAANTLPAANESLKTLIIDMLNYGAAAQVNFNRHADALANANFEEYQQYASEGLATPLVNDKLESETANNGAVTKIGTAVSLEARVGIKMTFTMADGHTLDDNTKMVVTDADGNVLQTITDLELDSKGRIVGVFDGLAAREMRTVVKCTLYEGDTVASNTMAYSICSYAYYAANTAGMPANTVALTNAMVIYGDSAAAYFGG